MNEDVFVFDTASALASAVASRFVALLERVEEPQIALTGGTIAELVHRQIASLATSSSVDFSRATFWFGDERFVPSSSPDRNAGQARAAFLTAVGATRVFEIPSSDEASTAEDAASAYEQLLRAEGSGTFDLVMLGIGPDGHVASLFPGYPQLDVDDGLAVAVHDSPKPPPDRVSLTFSALNRSKETWLIASGSAKAPAVASTLAPSGSIHDTPARGISPTHGRALWFLDLPANGGS